MRGNAGERLGPTFSLCDGGGGSDGAEGGAARIGRESPGHRHRVADPRSGVDGSDRLIYTDRGRSERHS